MADDPIPPTGANPPSSPSPQTPTPTPIQAAWMDFTGSVRILLVPQADDRPLDQYLAFRDTVLALVQSPEFLSQLEASWAPFTDYPMKRIGDALLMELKAFPLSVEVAKATEKATPESKPWWRKLLGRASTVTDSVKDLMDSLPPYVKGGITLFKELLDLFKGEE